MKISKEKPHLYSHFCKKKNWVRPVLRSALEFFIKFCVFPYSTPQKNLKYRIFKHDFFCLLSFIVICFWGRKKIKACFSREAELLTVFPHAKQVYFLTIFHIFQCLFTNVHLDLFRCHPSFCIIITRIGQKSGT